jgi:SAM-dependent methyltransferase
MTKTSEMAVQTAQAELEARLEDLKLRYDAVNAHDRVKALTEALRLLHAGDFEGAQFELGIVIGDLRRHSNHKCRENGDRIKELFVKLTGAAESKLILFPEKTVLAGHGKYPEHQQGEFIAVVVEPVTELVAADECLPTDLPLTTIELCRDRADRIRRLETQSIEARREVGGYLLEVKAKVKHGVFQKWLSANFDWSPRTAQRYISEAKNDTPVAIEPTPLEEQPWSSDDWETPDWLTQYVVELLGVDEQNILEPTAGTGQFVAQLEHRRKRLGRMQIVAVEIAQDRFDIGSEQYPVTEWYHRDILECNFEEKLDASVGNLPFSKAMPILDKVLNHLIKPDGRCLFVMPMDFFNAIGRAKALEDMGAIIYDRYRIVDRVPFLKHGQPVKGRQVYDCVYDIRRKPKGGIHCGERLVWQPR